jgi:16S rRNA (guanine527-N7)-methyltransferase
MAAESIRRLLEELSYETCSTTVEQLERFRQMLLAANRSVNLISRVDSATVADKLIGDSLALLTQLNYDTGATLLDLGSGAGFPWIPQKLIR